MLSKLIQRLTNRCRDVLFFPTMDRYWRHRAAGRLTCLLYHGVSEPGAFPFLEAFGAPVISPSDLAAELGFLRDQGARFMTFADLLRGEFPSTKEFGVIVSFDDGLRCNYEQGLPVLDSLGITGVVFQSTALVGASKLIWEHELYWRASEPSSMANLMGQTQSRWPESIGMGARQVVEFLRERIPLDELETMLAVSAREMSSSANEAELAVNLYPMKHHLQLAKAHGHQIGGHGHNHYKRANIDRLTFEAEIRKCSEVLTSALGEAPCAFSYPFNSYQPGDAQICSRYFAQVATVDGLPIRLDHDRLSIPRYTWPGPARNLLRSRRWLWTGRI